MLKNNTVITPKKVETAEFIVYKQSTTSNFIQYQSSNSLVPSSLDQVMKNAIIVNIDPVVVNSK